jgi:voltage-gated sodium channel
VNGFPARLRRIVDHRAFQNAVIVLIVANAAVMGFETSATVMSRWGDPLRAFNAMLQGAFVLEIALRIAAFWPRPLAFFRHGWNVFDFVVVSVSLVPAAGPVANVVRVARVMRAGRLLSTVPELRLIIETMLRSIPSMGHVLLLLGMLFYVYGVIGYHLFGVVDPVHWGTLPRAFESLFQILTLEGWVEMQKAAGPRQPASVLFYASYIFLAVFVVVNLFIAVVINNLESVKSDERRRGEAEAAGEDVAEHVARLRAELESLERALLARTRGWSGDERQASRKLRNVTE